MKPSKIVSRDEWLTARRALLKKEKAHMREGDRLAAERRGLPWVKIEKSYTFETERGRKTLADLFDGRGQARCIKRLQNGPANVTADFDKAKPEVVKILRAHVDDAGELVIDELIAPNRGKMSGATYYRALIKGDKE